MARYWTINGRFLAQPLTGVQRYAREIVRAMDQLLSEGMPLARDLDIEIVAPPDADLTPFSAICSRRIGRLCGHAWEQLVLPCGTRDGLLSFCNTGPVAARKQIVCIHDVNTMAMPKSYSVPFRALYRLLLPALGRVAQTIATVSDYSAGELVRFGICGPDKIVVAPDGHEHALRWQARHSAATQAVAGPNTIVMVGSPAPHKNAALILGLAERLSAAGLRLAVVGVSDARVFNAATPRLIASNVAWLGRLSDEEISALLRDSMCLAFPSFVEGFGLPPLEAMAIGCPVIVSDRASLPEICGEAALYASPEAADQWIEQFRRLHGTPGLRKQMIGRGKTQASRFRWQASAELFLRAMAKADGIAVPEQPSTPSHTFA